MHKSWVLTNAINPNAYELMENVHPSRKFPPAFINPWLPPFHIFFFNYIVILPAVEININGSIQLVLFVCVSFFTQHNVFSAYP